MRIITDIAVAGSPARLTGSGSCGFITGFPLLLPTPGKRQGLLLVRSGQATIQPVAFCERVGVSVESGDSQPPVSLHRVLSGALPLPIEQANFQLPESAALHIATLMDMPWPLMFAFIIVPPFIRHRVYDWIGRRRYQWYGKRDACWVPDTEIQNRFLN